MSLPVQRGQRRRQCLGVRWFGAAHHHRHDAQVGHGDLQKWQHHFHGMLAAGVRLLDVPQAGLAAQKTGGAFLDGNEAEWRLVGRPVLDGAAGKLLAVGEPDDHHGVVALPLHLAEADGGHRAGIFVAGMRQQQHAGRRSGVIRRRGVGEEALDRRAQLLRISRIKRTRDLRRACFAGGGWRLRPGRLPSRQDDEQHEHQTGGRGASHAARTP